jgi:ABC-type uncharacterized transport system ATPase subunit
MSVIKVQGLSKNFGAIKAVDQLSFEVEAGQVFWAKMGLEKVPPFGCYFP